MPVYYTRTEEATPVFHLWTTCEEGKKIKEEDKVVALHGRRLCEVCRSMTNKPKA
jgi:hypothetical protein